MKKLLITLVALIMLFTSCTTVPAEKEVVIEVEVETEIATVDFCYGNDGNDENNESQPQEEQEEPDSNPIPLVPEADTTSVEATNTPDLIVSNENDKADEEKVEVAPERPFTNDMYVVGTPFEWNATEAGQMIANDNQENFSLTINITEDDYEEWALDYDGNTCAVIKVLNNINDTWYGIEEEDFEATSWTLTPDGSTNLYLKAGQYIVTYNATEDKAIVTTIK